MMLDANTWLGHWHNQKFSVYSSDKMRECLRACGINQAIISSIDAVFSSDPQPWNEELAHALAGVAPFFIHAPVVKPTLADRDDALTCYASGPVRVLRLLPGFHSYSLNSSELKPFFQKCSRLRFTILVQMRMEDERSQHKLVQVPPVNTEELVELAAAFPDINFLCLSAYFPEAVALSSKVKNLYVDISFAEKLNTVSELIDKIPVSQVVFGSHSPFLYPEAAWLKMEHAEVSREDKNLIMSENALRILAVDQ